MSRLLTGSCLPRPGLSGFRRQSLKAAARRCAVRRQDQSRPVRHRSRRRALPMACRATRSTRPHIPGGSSSPAVAVAAGPVSCARPTRPVPGGFGPFNNIVGLKPTRGLLSTRGVIPACRSLDCVSIFADRRRCPMVSPMRAGGGALEFDPATAVHGCARRVRHPWHVRRALPSGCRGDQREFFGNAEAAGCSTRHSPELLLGGELSKSTSRRSPRRRRWSTAAVAR